MPNWVYNGLTIEGNPDEVNKLVAQVGKPFTVPIENRNMGDIHPNGYPTKYQEQTYTNPIFAFWNIISPYDKGITAEEYAKQPMRSELSVDDPNFWADHQRLEKIDKSWYSWNITNWGVKWDVAVSDDEKYPDTDMVDIPAMIDENTMSVSYNFNTPWGIADEALTELSRQYPTLLMKLYYQEETGWGGERKYKGGFCFEYHEYGWQCRNCDHEEVDTPYCEECDYDMCPSCGWGEPMDEDRAQCEEHREKADV